MVENKTEWSFPPGAQAGRKKKTFTNTLTNPQHWRRDAVQKNTGHERVIQGNLYLGV